MSTMLLLMSMSFLTKVPAEYFCVNEGQTDEFSCTPSDFCAADSGIESFRPNMDLSDSYDNWILRFDLHCASGAKIGMIGAVPFIGWVITLTFIPRLSDAYYGRQKLMVVGYLITVLSFTVLLLSTTFTLLISSMFMMGAMATIRVQVSIVYLYETLKRSDYRYFYTALAIFEGVSGVGAALYFKYVSKDAMGLLWCSYFCMVLGFLASLLYPESPRYLIKSD